MSLSFVVISAVIMIILGMFFLLGLFHFMKDEKK